MFSLRNFCRFSMFRYIQIIVSRLATSNKPDSYPSENLKAYEANASTKQHTYIAAEFDVETFKSNLFTIGDGKTYSRSAIGKARSILYENAELYPDTFYSVFQRRFRNNVSHFNFHSVFNTLSNLSYNSAKCTRYI